jgi:hypothetical protein
MAAQAGSISIFKCECALGEKADVYHVQVVQQRGPGEAVIQFSNSSMNQRPETFNVSGTLVEFHLTGPDLVFTFDYPGPHTIVFSEKGGRIQRELECSSAFTPVFTWQYAVCFSGKQALANGIQVPDQAIIYTRAVHPFKQVATVPFRMMYLELSKLSAK